jgi:glycosyltransferase involved in cell wall biosynthesis
VLVTVAICTWNRGQILDQTLTQLRSLRVPVGVEWELLIVNNNSTDDTAAVIARHTRFLPIRPLFEPSTGKSYAANLAIREALGELMLWTDDDVLVDPSWLAEHVAATRTLPDAVFIGGAIEPWFAISPPGWVQKNLHLLAGPYAIRKADDQTRYLAERDTLPCGANLLIRRTALLTQQFDCRLGPSGKALIMWEDHELLTRLLKCGYRGGWAGTARVRHLIGPQRLTRKYIWEWNVGAGKTFVRHNGIDACTKFLGAPRWALRKYWSTRILSWSLGPLQNQAWLREFQEAAFWSGVIQEAQTLDAS